jgi:hypothetical protein
VTFESNGLAAFTTGRRRSLLLPALGDPLGYRAMLADFLRALRTGEPPFFTLDLARRDLSLLERAERAMAARAPDARWTRRGRAARAGRARRPPLGAAPARRRAGRARLSRSPR